MKKLLLILFLIASPLCLMAQFEGGEVKDVSPVNRDSIRKAEEQKKLTEEKKRLEEFKKQQEAERKHQEAEKKRQQAEQERRAAEARRAAMGSTVTLSVGMNADIYVDKRHVGKGQCQEWLEHGRHYVECTKEDYTTEGQYIDVQKGKKNHFTLKTPQPTSTSATLTVDKSSAGIIIAVDGREMHTTNGSWNGKLSFGTHMIECKKDRHRTTKKTINVVRGGQTKFTLPAPMPIYGVLKVEGTQGAMVYLDGVPYGTTPLNKKILIGSYQLTVEKNYYTKHHESLFIEEDKTTNKTITLKSSIPVNITTIPQSVGINLNGKDYYTPINDNLPEGTYEVNVRRQHAVCKKHTYITIDSLHKAHTIKLKRDYTYDDAPYIDVDYDAGLQAVGLGFGACGGNVAVELNLHWGLQWSEPIYYTTQHTANLNNYDLQTFKYSHWGGDVKAGATFWCGPRLRLAPMAGVQYIKLREKSIGDNTEKRMANGGYASIIGSLRFYVGLTSHMGLHVTPQYRYCIAGSHKLPDLSSDIDRWVNGFSVKAGLVIQFYNY